MIVTDDTFDTVVQTHKIILIDFFADWCGPCKMMNPILEEISKENGLWVGKLNVDENLAKTEEYSVQTIPTMVLFVDGKPVHIVHGAMPKHALMKELKQWI